MSETTSPFLAFPSLRCIKEAQNLMDQNISNNLSTYCTSEFPIKNRYLEEI
jgi:hypothetical protein